MFKLFAKVWFRSACLVGSFYRLFPDIDECAMLPSLCLNGLCVNLQPGYRCECRQGWRFDPVSLICTGRYGLHTAGQTTSLAIKLWNFRIGGRW